MLAATVAKITRDVDDATIDRISEAVRKIFGRVLKELADLDNPMRTPLGSEPGEGGLFAEAAAQTSGQSPAADNTGSPHAPDVSAELNDIRSVQADDLPAEPSRPDRRRSSELPTIAPDPEPGEARSRFDPATSLVLYNERHADYLLVKDDEPILLDYLATLVAKEYVVYNNPRAQPEDLAEEMVRMLVRVRRHLPRRR